MPSVWTSIDVSYSYVSVIIFSILDIENKKTMDMSLLDTIVRSSKAGNATIRRLDNQAMLL